MAVRRKLWDDMEDFASAVRLPWMIIGDFNDISKSYDKSGGVGAPINRRLSFNNSIVNCGLSDLAFQGPSYTWTNRRQGSQG